MLILSEPTLLIELMVPSRSRYRKVSRNGASGGGSDFIDFLVLSDCFNPFYHPFAFPTRYLHINHSGSTVAFYRFLQS